MAQDNQACFDSVKLVQDGLVLAGAMPVAGLVRLLEGVQQGNGTLGTLGTQEGTVQYRVQGAVDGRQRPILKLKVSGILMLQCQRCLEGFEHKIAIETVLRLVAPEVLEREYDDNPDEPDCVAASATFDLIALIEDEILLALPAYPRHEAGRCTGRLPIPSDPVEASGAKHAAFSALQALKQKVN